MQTPFFLDIIESVLCSTKCYSWRTLIPPSFTNALVFMCVFVAHGRRKSFVFCGLYAALVFGGQYFMRQRPKLDLRKPLVLWSLSLAIFR